MAGYRVDRIASRPAPGTIGRRRAIAREMRSALSLYVYHCKADAAEEQDNRLGRVCALLAELVELERLDIRAE